MADPFVAEIRIFGFNFAPTGWAFCDGSILPISQNTALFSLLGTFYGGDGKSNFALPNLQGSAPVNQGQSSASGRDYFLGETAGVDAVTLLETEMPAHTHFVKAAGDDADLKAPTPTRALGKSTPGFIYGSSQSVQAMAPQAIGPTGGSLPHNNMMPYLVFNFCIALQGVFPPRG